MSGMLNDIEPRNLKGRGLCAAISLILLLQPVWVCPSAAQPWVPAGMTFVWVLKEGYDAPPGQPRSVFGDAAAGNSRDVKIEGDTRVEIRLVRR
jgi:hypothetical protein